jgi:hypothetical protein
MRSVSAEPVTVGGVTVTPRSRVLEIRLRNGGFVWNRPTSVLVERDGRARRIPIVDYSRVIQVGLLGLAALIAGAGLLRSRDRAGGAA